MKWITIILLVSSSFQLVANHDSIAVEGYWFNETKEYIVEIYHEGSHFKGKIVWLSDSFDDFIQPLRDVMNSDPKLRSRLVLGLDVLYDFEYDDDAWRNGQVYNIKNGSDYNAKLRLDSDGNLTWTGYYGILFFLGKTKVWTRVNDVAKYGLK